MAGSGIRLDIQLEGGDQVTRKISELGNLSSYLDDIFKILSAAGENQTRRRIEESGPAPDGTPWKAWSPEYAETRHAGHSLLISSGRMLDSIHAFIDGDIAGWGTNVEYAPKNQLTRPFIGISESDREEMQSLLIDFFYDLIKS